MVNSETHRDLAIIKLGGSVITSSSGEVDIANIRSIAEELRQYEKPVILVHGGGTIAKNIVLEHRLTSDFLSSEQLHIVERLRNSMRSLASEISRILGQFDLPHNVISPHTFLESSGGEIVEHNSFLGKLLPNNHLLLHGDVIGDTQHDYYACSSDQIVSYLAKIVQPKVVIFLTNVDGVYANYPPKSATSIPIPIVRANDLSSMSNEYFVGIGDMYTKLIQAVSCVHSTELCCIINGRVQGNLTKALYGTVEFGTKIMGEEEGR